MRYLKGGPKSIGPPRCFLQLGPQGSSPTFSLSPDQLQPLLELVLEVLENGGLLVLPYSVDNRHTQRWL